MEANLLNLIFRRQAAAAEAIDKDLRAGAGHAGQLVGHLVWIVGQRVDLILCQCLREAVVAAIGRAHVLHHHGLLDRRHRQPQGGAVVAATHSDRRGNGPKALGRRLHLVGAGVQVLEHRQAAIVHGRHVLDAIRIDDRDLRDDERRLGLVEHGDT